MKASVVRALATDAYRQVLDNWVFRILACLAGLPILVTFLVGWKPDTLELFFGWKSWSYAEVFTSFGMKVLPPDPRGTAIEVLLGLCFEFLAGDVGMLLALSATAFFVPRLLEKGTAELYFHRPVSRTSLLLSRYFAGLLFIALTAGILVTGMYLGLLLVSDYNDPGILLAALQLTYVFALIHAFSVLAGVVTRSTVAAILLAALFFFSNGCIHQGWIALEQAESGPGASLREDSEEETDEAESAAPASPSRAWRIFRTTLDGLHLVLPKTSDGPVLARKLRRALARPLYFDEDTLVRLARLPADWQSRAPGVPPALPPEAFGEPRLAGATQDGWHCALGRRAAVQREVRFGERVRKRAETSSQATETLKEALEAAGHAPVRASATLATNLGRRDQGAGRLAWSTPASQARAWSFQGQGDAWIYTLYVEAPATVAPTDFERRSEELWAELVLDLAALEDWYPSRLTLTAPLPYNSAYSVVSSLLFAALLLSLGAWRLARLAF